MLQVVEVGDEHVVEVGGAGVHELPEEYGHRL